MSLDVAIIGAPDITDIESGAAYIFEQKYSNEWIQTSRLLPSDTTQNDQFGASVSVNGTIVIVGAPDIEKRPGAAYIFEYENWSNWKEKSKLLPSDIKYGDVEFGYSVAVRGNRAVVSGLHQYADNSDLAWSAHIFERIDTDAWAETSMLLPAHPPAVEVLEISVSVGEEFVIAGELYTYDNVNTSGDVYIF